MDTGQRRLGSSPLTRGKPSAAWLARPAAGLIPAHAGKTRWSCCAALGHGAHPRSRGENSVFWRLVSVISGSSPLTRGKRFTLIPGPHDSRLIPAHAGKTALTGCVTSAYTAHPRSRGENQASALPRWGSLGSSPLTRGKPADRILAYRDHRLIPAHAGKTVLRATSSALRRAHPRSRGENSETTVPAAFAAGSSPLTRGKRLIPALRSGSVRLIPAHAGKTI